MRKLQQCYSQVKYKQALLVLMGFLLFSGVESEATCKFSPDQFGRPPLPNTGEADMFASNWLLINAGVTRNHTNSLDIDCRRRSNINIAVENANPLHKDSYAIHNLYYYNDQYLGGNGSYTVSVTLDNAHRGSGMILLKEASGGGNIISVSNIPAQRRLRISITQQSNNPPSNLRPPGFIRSVRQPLVRISGGSINMSLYSYVVYGYFGSPEVGPPEGWEPPPPGYEPECIPAGLKVYTPEEINFNSISQDQVASNRRLIRDFKINILRDKVSRDKAIEYCDDAIPGKLTFTLESVSNGGGVIANGQDVALNNGLLFGIEENGRAVTFSQPRPFELRKAENILMLGYRAIIKQDGNKKLTPGSFTIRTKVRIEY